MLSVCVMIIKDVCAMNKNVIVTGASRGIGAAIAKKLACSGYSVIINYNRSEKKAIDLVNEIVASGHEACAIKADVTDRQAVLQMVDQAHERFGPIHALVNNAGIAKWGLFMDTTLDQWQRLFDVNVTGMFHMCQAVLPDMVRDHCGSIVNMSSVCAEGSSCEVAYSATKGAVVSFTKALAKEFGPSGIRVNCIAPGFIGDTDMNAQYTAEEVSDIRQNTSLEEIGEVKDIAHAAEFLLSNKSKFITGTVLKVDGGLVL